MRSYLGTPFPGTRIRGKELLIATSPDPNVYKTVQKRTGQPVTNVGQLYAAREMEEMSARGVARSARV